MENIGTATDFMVEKKWAEIKEVKGLGSDNTNCIRLYHSQWHPDKDSNSFTLQIRTFKPITEWQRSTDKPRNMMATVTISLAELKELVAIAEAQITAK